MSGCAEKRQHKRAPGWERWGNDRGRGGGGRIHNRQPNTTKPQLKRIDGDRPDPSNREQRAGRRTDDVEMCQWVEAQPSVITRTLIAHCHRHCRDREAMDRRNEHVGNEAQHQLLQRQIHHSATAVLWRTLMAYFFIVILRCASSAAVSSSAPAA